MSIREATSPHGLMQQSPYLLGCDTYWARHNLEDHDLNLHRREDLKSRAY